MANNDENKYHSLKRDALRAISISMILMMLAVILVGIRFYIYTGIKIYKNEIKHLSNYSLSMIDRDYFFELLYKTKEIYDSIPEEERKDAFTEQYKEHFRPLLDERYVKAREVLFKCRENSDFSDIYMGFYDKENERLVMVLDGDLKDYYYIPGQYISNENGFMESWDKIEKIMKSDWYMSFAHTSLMGYAVTNYDPIYDEDNNIIGVIGVDTAAMDFTDETMTYLALFVPALVLVFIFLFFWISRAIDMRIIKHVNSLVEAAKSYTNRDKINMTSFTSYFASVHLPHSNELTQLRDTMADMESDIYKSMKEIRRVSSEKERIAAELDIAAEIQKSAIPTRFPEDSRFDLYASMDPAKEVAGDFYDFFMVDEEHLAVVMADVSGKGVPAALFMMKGKEMIKHCTARGGTPSEILAYVNDELAKDNEHAMFITIWLGIMDINTGAIIASSAGHEYPFIMDKDGTFRMFEDSHGVVCGAMEGIEYEDYSLTIPSGGGIFLYTDGIPEAINTKDEAFGLERIEENLNAHPGASSRERIEFMQKAIEDFASGIEQFDDITMMCLIR